MRWPGESCTCQTSQKPEGYKLILVFLEKQGYKKDALDKRLLANRRYEAIARRPGQTLHDFLGTENVAHADAMKAGVGIDPDRRAYHSSRVASLTTRSIGRSATLAMRNHDESFRGKGKDSKGATHNGKSKGSKSGKK